MWRLKKHFHACMGVKDLRNMIHQRFATKDIRHQLREERSTSRSGVRSRRSRQCSTAKKQGYWISIRGRDSLIVFRPWHFGYLPHVRIGHSWSSSLMRWHDRENSFNGVYIDNTHAEFVSCVPKTRTRGLIEEPRCMVPYKGLEVGYLPYCQVRDKNLSTHN